MPGSATSAERTLVCPCGTQRVRAKYCQENAWALAAQVAAPPALWGAWEREGLHLVVAPGGALYGEALAKGHIVFDQVEPTRALGVAHVEGTTGEEARAGEVTLSVSGEDRRTLGGEDTRQLTLAGLDGQGEPAEGQTLALSPARPSETRAGFAHQGTYLLTPAAGAEGHPAEWQGLAATRDGVLAVTAGGRPVEVLLLMGGRGSTREGLWIRPDQAEQRQADFGRIRVQAFPIERHAELETHEEPFRYRDGRGQERELAVKQGRLVAVYSRRDPFRTDVGPVVGTLDVLTAGTTALTLPIVAEADRAPGAPLELVGYWIQSRNGDWLEVEREGKVFHHGAVQSSQARRQLIDIARWDAAACRRFGLPELFTPSWRQSVAHDATAFKNAVASGARVGEPTGAILNRLRSRAEAIAFRERFEEAHGSLSRFLREQYAGATAWEKKFLLLHLGGALDVSERAALAPWLEDYGPEDEQTTALEVDKTWAVTTLYDEDVQQVSAHAAAVACALDEGAGGPGRAKHLRQLLAMSLHQRLSALPPARREALDAARRALWSSDDAYALAKAAHGYLDDDEQQAYDAPLGLPDAERQALWDRFGGADLAFLNETERANLQSVCQAADRAQALRQRVKLAVDGLGTADPNLERAMDWVRVLPTDARVALLDDPEFTRLVSGDRSDFNHLFRRAGLDRAKLKTGALRPEASVRRGFGQAMRGHYEAQRAARGKGAVFRDSSRTVNQHLLLRYLGHHAGSHPVELNERFVLVGPEGKQPRDLWGEERFWRIDDHVKAKVSGSQGLLCPALLERIEARAAEGGGRRLGPDEVFRLGLDVAGGDVFRALLVCHDTLRAVARGLDERHTGVTMNMEFFGRCLNEDLTGSDTLAIDYAGQSSGKFGEVAGNWYYFFGLAAFALATHWELAEDWWLVSVGHNVYDIGEVVYLMATRESTEGGFGIEPWGNMAVRGVYTVLSLIPFSGNALSTAQADIFALAEQAVFKYGTEERVQSDRLRAGRIGAEMGAQIGYWVARQGEYFGD